ALAVAEDEIARRNPNPFDFNAHAKVDHFAARPLVLRVQSAAEGRKAERLDPGRVPDETIEHRSRGAQVARASGHELAPQRVAKRAARGDIDLVRAKIVERLQHEPERLRADAARRAGAVIEDVGLEDGHGPADKLHVRLERSNGLRQELAPPSHLIQDTTAVNSL